MDTQYKKYSNFGGNKVKYVDFLNANGVNLLICSKHTVIRVLVKGL